MSVMIDWLKFRVPLLHEPLSASGCIVSFDNDGLVEWTKGKRNRLTGSYDDTINISSTGPLNSDGYCTELEIDGNITKFLQGHNVWGSSDHCGLALALIHWLIFKDPCNTINTPEPFVKLDPRSWVVNRIDITSYADVGSRHNVRVSLDTIALTGHTKYQRANSTKGTVYFNKNSRRWGFKFYDKLKEVSSTAKGHRINADIPTQELLKKSVETKIRCELVLRQNEMRDRDINTLADIKPLDLFIEYLNRLKFESNNKMTSKKVHDLPKKLKLTYLAWSQGHDVRSLVSDATFYRHKSDLSKLGIDLDQPPRPDDAPSNVISFSRYIECMPISMPVEVESLIYTPRSA